MSLLLLIFMRIEIKRAKYTEQPSTNARQSFWGANEFCIVKITSPPRLGCWNISFMECFLYITGQWVASVNALEPSGEPAIKSSSLLICMCVCQCICVVYGTLSTIIESLIKLLLVLSDFHYITSFYWAENRFFFRMPLNLNPTNVWLKMKIFCKTFEFSRLSTKSSTALYCSNPQSIHRKHTIPPRAICGHCFVRLVTWGLEYLELWLQS